jgi:four helix bundle protein
MGLALRFVWWGMNSKRDVGAVAELDVWQRSMDLVAEVYRLVDRLPAQERFGLAEQLRRASASIPANIAEGNARGHRREYVQFLTVARGSLAEVATHLESARRVGYWSDAELKAAGDLIRRVRQMLNRLIAALSK